MTDRPILFSTPMVQAIRDGRKTQTRRALKPQPSSVDENGRWYLMSSGGESLNCYDLPYAPGDRLWVREAWQALCEFDYLKPSDIPAGSDVLYTADRPDTPWDSRKRPGIHMPRWASRLTLTVTDVRVQRLQEISCRDCLDEGWPGAEVTKGVGGFKWFANLWDRLNAKRGCGWDANPWIVALTFKINHCNIDRMEE